MRWIGLLIVVALMIGGGYWYWTTTPQYAVSEAKDAAKTHNLAKFEKYVDTESVASGMVDDFLTRPVGQLLGNNVFGKVLIAGFMGVFKPQMVKGIQGDLRQFVETGNFNKPSGDDGPQSAFSLGALDGKLGFKKGSYRKIESVKVDGNVARVTLIVHNDKYNRDLSVDVDMRKSDNHWVVTRFANLPDFLSTLVELESGHGTSRIAVPGDEDGAGERTHI